MAEGAPPSREDESEALRQVERACFQGVILATLCYGALVMIYVQLAQVMTSKPKRGRIFWWLVVYLGSLLPLATLGIGGMLKFTELAYIDHRNDPGGPLAWHLSHRRMWVNVISVASITALPWISDLLMFYRVMVVWNYQYSLLGLAVPVYLCRLAMSIPVLITETRGPTVLSSLGDAYFALCAALNVFFTIAIAVRIYLLRTKARTVLGNLQASYYSSPLTIMVESGALYTVWTLLHLGFKVGNSNVRDVFAKPYFFINAITRLLIALRMAQNRAWSKDIVTASATGVLDWQVSSSASNALEPSSALDDKTKMQSIPKQFRADLAAM